MNLYEYRHDWSSVTVSLASRISTRYLKSFTTYSGFKSWKSSAHADTYSDPSEKSYIFLHVLDYFGHLDFFFYSRKHSIPGEKAKIGVNLEENLNWSCNVGRILSWISREKIF